MRARPALLAAAATLGGLATAQFNANSFTAVSPPQLSTGPLAGSATDFVEPFVIPVAPFGAPQEAAERRRALRDLDEESLERSRLLQSQFLARRRLLQDSDDWKLSSWSERRAKLAALRKEYREREEWLRDDYEQKRQALLASQD